MRCITTSDWQVFDCRFRETFSDDQEIKSSKREIRKIPLGRCHRMGIGRWSRCVNPESVREGPAIC